MGHGARGLFGRRHCWDYFPHDHARSRAYRWGEDGLLGITDRECRLCFALALWNGRDPILKERLFGLTGPEGNHGEDVKECYFYLDAHAHALVPEGALQVSAGRVPLRAAGGGESPPRARHEPEFELLDTGVFDDNRYFDVFVEYAKASPNDILIRITVGQSRPGAGDAAPAADAVVSQHLVVGLRPAEGVLAKPRLGSRGAMRRRSPPSTRRSGTFRLAVEPGPAAHADVAVHRERDQLRRGSSASPNPTPLREGRLSRLRRPRRGRTR